MDQIAKHTFTKMNQDISKSKYSPELYYEGKNIRIITNEDFGSVTNEDGNELKLTLPDIISNPTVTKTHLNLLDYPLVPANILGHTSIKGATYLLSKYQLSLPTAKLFYAQDQNVTPYIDSNIRIIIDGDTFFENFDSTSGAVDGPALPTGTTVRVQSFHLATEPNQAAPDPTLYLEVYENGVLVNKQSASLDYINSVTLFYDITIDPNKVYFFHAYSLPEPGIKDNPFTAININDYIVDGDIVTIHKVTSDYTIELLFLDTIEIPTYKLDVVGFYESESIQKIYWVDNGTSELRFANVADPNLIELDKKFLSTVPTVNLTQPTITGFVTGGSSHTSGAIQYAYNLYKLNGAQTKISPLSSITYLNNNDKGNQTNIQVDKAPIISITGIDTTFDRIRLYAIKYNSLNATPEIRLISEQPVTSSLQFIDDNNSTVNTLTLAEFQFLGGEIYYPKHIAIKDNHLFLFNYKTKQFDIDFDARAYRYDSTGTAKIKTSQGVETTFTANTIPNIQETHDAINPTNKALEGDVDFNKYIWKSVSGTGPSTEEVTPTFDQVFEFVSTTNTFNEYFYDSDNNQVGENDPTVEYSTFEIITITTYSPRTGLTFSNPLLSVGGTFTSDTICSDGLPNSPGNNSWQIGLTGSNLVLTTTYVGDTRCTFITPQPQVGLVTVNDGVTGYNTSFTFKNFGAQTSDVQTRHNVTDFDPNGLQITITTNPQVTGVLGGIGPNVEFEIKYKTVSSNIGQPTMNSSPSTATINNPVQLTGLKSGEVYRLYLEFLTNDGSYIFPKWIADVKIPEIGTDGSLPSVDVNGNVNYPYIETKLINLPTDTRITGWRTSIVERTEFDRSVVTQGLINAAIDDNYNPSVDAIPSYFQRTVSNRTDYPNQNNAVYKPVKLNGPTSGTRNLSHNTGSTTTGGTGEITSQPNNYEVSQDVGFLYTPETVLNKRLLATSGRIRRIGLIKNTWTESYREVFGTDDQIIDEVPQIPGDTNLTQSTFLEGAQVLANFVGVGSSTPNQRNAKYIKLISDNKDIGNTPFYSRKRFAYTRYFGGLSYLATNSGSLYHTTIDNKVGFISPILNTFNINGYTVAGQGNIPVMYPNTDLTGVVFKYFTGSAIVLTQDAYSTIASGTTELNSTDQDDYGVLAEIYRVVPNQYGGDTYQARQLNRTIPYSNIVPLTINTPTTEHQGDTFIQKFNFLKTFRADNGVIQISEIVSFPVETTINLDLRFDLTKDRPDNFEADENTSYGFNLAYNQLNNIIKGVTKPFNFNETTEFPTNIIPSKLKTNGELIDSFTDFLINDVKTLDGQYNEITGVGEYKDSLYAFQRSAIAYLAINPRVQLQATDGIPIELGSGRLIERYQYITTSSGTLNKWSIQKATNGMMYVDLINKSINFLSDSPQKITTVNGFYNYFLNYLDDNRDVLESSNPVINQGIISFYDRVKEDTYFTFLCNNPVTIVYNGLSQGFTNFVDFFPKHYLRISNQMVTTNDTTSLWEHNKESDKNTYYGIYYPSSITIVSNDNPDFNKIFNNIHFNSEFYNNNVDVSDITFNKLRVWNEYQDTGVTDLESTVYRSSIKRRLRKWNLIIPRIQNGRDRISNYWTYIKLEFDKTDLPLDKQADYKFTLHDILVSYTPKQ
jgi:hypothetical protein